jgi:hypothetical protein
MLLELNHSNNSPKSQSKQSENVESVESHLLLPAADRIGSYSPMEKKAKRSLGFFVFTFILQNKRNPWLSRPAVI